VASSHERRVLCEVASRFRVSAPFNKARDTHEIREYAVHNAVDDPRRVHKSHVGRSSSCTHTGTWTDNQLILLPLESLHHTDQVQPAIPSASSARSSLNSLTVRTAGSMTGYSRDEFPHWTTSGGCSVRETVLARDGSNVVQDSSCAASSGTWRSPYDGATQTSASEIDIDHMVPLANSWIVSPLPTLHDTN
jgi:hypothetical protein